MRALPKLATLVVSVLVLITPSARAEIPPLLAWQGVALDSLDQPLADGSYIFRFSIWNDDVGGDSLWGEERIVDVQQGVLNVLLGEVTPLPDTLFDLAYRWLQVQFEGEDPYFPRTRIVSVGYAFRVEKLQGAMGGEVRSDILLKDQFSFPALRLFREGTETQIAALFGGGQGGYFRLNDGAGTMYFQLEPDDNGGGQLTLLTNEVQTSGILAFNGGADSPVLLMGGVSGAVFDLGQTGDAVVQFPVNAIADAEILDEAGIAASPQGGSYLVTTSYVTLASATATFPDRGFVVVISEATFRSDTVNAYLNCLLRENGSNAKTWYWDPGDVDGWYDQRQTHVFTDSVTAGTFTYELRVSQNSGSCNAIAPKVTVLYFPTAYGTVSTTAATATGSDPNTLIVQGKSESPASPGIDVASERAASIEFNEERIRREVEDMKARLAQLETILQARGELTRVDQ